MVGNWLKGLSTVSLLGKTRLSRDQTRERQWRSSLSLASDETGSRNELKDWIIHADFEGFYSNRLTEDADHPM